MKIKDGLNLPGWKVEIPDAIREDLPEFFKEMGYKVGAEIGTEKGRFAECLAKEGLKLYCIDLWEPYDDYHERAFDAKAMKSNYEQTVERLAPYDCTIMKMASMDAVKEFEDESLDFVYIDGNHGFKFVTEDIYEWTKKVKKGGVISGHDYWTGSSRPFHMDVQLVLDGYTKAAQLKKWYVLGKRWDGKRDRFRSWFFIKE